LVEASASGCVRPIAYFCEVSGHEVRCTKSLTHGWRNGSNLALGEGFRRTIRRITPFEFLGFQAEKISLAEISADTDRV